MSQQNDARFLAFVDATAASDRNQVAFWEFEDAIHNAVMCASMINSYDVGQEGERERSGLSIVVTEMFFRVLPRVELGTLIGVAEDIGYALRYGVIEPRRDALDDIVDTRALEDLARKGQAAEKSNTDRRIAELSPREDD